MDKKDKAEACFQKGFNCAQAVFFVFASELGLEEEMALKVAAGFGGGLGTKW